MKFKNDAIPRIFYSTLSEKPIENCVFCGVNVLSENLVYVIEKVFKNGSSDSEYAICMDCAMKMKGGMSEESQKSMTDYFEKLNVLLEYREYLKSDLELDVEDFLKKCVVKGRSVSDMQEFQLAGIFRGLKLYEGAIPLVFSLEAILEVNELLSAKTKEEMDGYIDEIDDMPPEWKAIFKTKKPILV